VGHAFELRADGLDEGVLLVGDPQPHRLAQSGGHLAGADQQAAHFVGATGQQGLSEPDAAGGQFADGIEGLVALLGLQAVDAQPQGADVAVGQAQQVGVLLAGGEHGLVAAQVERDCVVGQSDVVGVFQFVLDLGNGPVSCKAAVSDEAEDVPADEPTGQGEGEFGGRTESLGSSGTVGVGAVGQAATEFQGSLQAVDAVAAAPADTQGMTAAGAGGLLHVEEHSLKDGTLWPTEPHRPSPVCLLGHVLLYV
jgi:hypothetical protein